MVLTSIVRLGPEGIGDKKLNVMWRGNQVWLHYVKNIIAADVSSAVFLASYLRHADSNKSYARAIEIIDLQKYRIVKQEAKIKAALKERLEVPFVFVVGKN